MLPSPSPSTSRRIACNALRRGVPILAAALVLHELATAAIAQETKPDPSRIIQYRGPMPWLPQELWGADVKLKFELYRSPEGGAAFWKESRTVSVGKNGWVEVDLGQVTSLPDEAFTTPFRFLSIWRDNVEFSPRKQVASLAYIASKVDQLLSKEQGKYAAGTTPASGGAAAKAPDLKKRLDELVDCGVFGMEMHPRPPVNWLEAVEAARKLNARLPTFEEWYGAYDGKAGKQLAGMEGHYEWVIPWVYEPTIHARLHELYRGKTVACYYEELSPMNNYPFRLVVESPSPKASP